MSKKIREIIEKYSENKSFSGDVNDWVGYIAEWDFDKLEEELQEHYDNKPPSLNHIKPKCINRKRR